MPLPEAVFGPSGPGAAVAASQHPDGTDIPAGKSAGDGQQVPVLQPRSAPAPAARHRQLLAPAYLWGSKSGHDRVPCRCAREHIEGCMTARCRSGTWCRRWAFHCLRSVPSWSTDPRGCGPSPPEWSHGRGPPSVEAATHVRLDQPSARRRLGHTGPTITRAGRRHPLTPTTPMTTYWLHQATSLKPLPQHASPPDLRLRHRNWLGGLIHGYAQLA